MGPKPKLKPIGSDGDDNTAEAPRRSTRNARGTGGAVRQMELVESLQVAPRVPQNAEVRRIKNTLGNQPENILAPSKASRKKAKGPEVCLTTSNPIRSSSHTKIPYVAETPPCPVLPRKEFATSVDSFGFYGSRKFSQHTQEDR